MVVQPRADQRTVSEIRVQGMATVVDERSVTKGHWH